MSIFRSLFLVISVFTFVSLHAVFEDHLKGTLNKTDKHSMRNVDFIYMINLDRRPEKWLMSLEALKPYGIIPYRFSAVNGWELTLEDINDVGVKFSPGMEGGFWGTRYLLDGNFQQHHEIIQHYGQNYFSHCMARGTIGIALSHISILKDAFDSGYETIWVMEDDVQIIRDPRILSDLIALLDQQVGKNNWDILFTDQDMRNRLGEYIPASGAAKRPDYGLMNDFHLKAQISSEFRKIGARFGAHSMIVRRSGLKKLLTFFLAHHIFLPYDMEYNYPQGMNIYTVMNDVVSNYHNISDNGSPNYLNNSQK